MTQQERKPPRVYVVFHDNGTEISSPIAVFTTLNKTVAYIERRKKFPGGKTLQFDSVPLDTEE